MGGLANGLTSFTGQASSIIAPYGVGGRPFGVMTLPNGLMCSGYGNIAQALSTATFTNVGITQTTSGTASSAGTLTGATRQYINFVTAAATTGQVAGIIPLAANNWRGNHKPVLGVIFRWPGETNLRLWIGLANATLGATVLATGPSALGNSHAALSFETGVSTKFRGSTCDGTNFSSADLVGGGAETPTIDQEYLVIIDPRTESGTACTFHLWNLTTGTYATLRKTTNVLLNTSATLLSWQASITTNENVLKNMQINSYFCIQN